ncbi:MAG: FAD-dependent oxidoreductase [Planctomycetia bacterium]|nr:FAD-dependent oxidoreductase [Planctomycetia bacterium]
MNPILIIGAGINGASLARELVLDGLDVIVVDSGDIASGTTAYSSRLIHGGLRYLEYADTALVRESLEERARLLRLAPDFVRALEFQIPVERRLGGFIDAVGKLVLGGRYRPKSRRGLWLVRTGLFFYDQFSGKTSLPRSSTQPIDDRRRTLLAPRYRNLCTYFDGQMPYPERFVAALLADARRAAEQAGTQFEVRTYSHVAVEGSTVVVTNSDTAQVDNSAPLRFEPAAVVNASGPWGDATLETLGFPSRKLIGGTKGSHIVVFHDALRAALQAADVREGSLRDAAIYAEAADGRPVFILPFGEGVLIGTTDMPYVGDPAIAIASEAEITYLLELTNDVLPGIGLVRSDVALHYAGVRPLPYADASTPAAISRRHSVVELSAAPWPAWTLVGGKLTTCRALAEEAAGIVLRKLNRAATHVSRERRIENILEDGPEETAKLAGDGDRRAVAGTAFSRGVVRRAIRTLWVQRLEDLVERRLMLHFARHLSRTTLDELAELMIEERKLRPDDRDEAIERTCRRLRTHFGRSVEP